jgi:hypothetical protein
VRNNLDRLVFRRQARANVLGEGPASPALLHGSVTIPVQQSRLNADGNPPDFQQSVIFFLFCAAASTFMRAGLFA